MDFQNRLKRWFKLRFAILYPFGVFIALFANSDDKSIRAGIWLILAGLLLRIWANGYAIKLERLTTSGPYAFIRHPLYFGTMLLALGFIIMLKFPYVGIVFLIVMVTIYYHTIKKEEGMLSQKFKEAYGDYKRQVPAMIPTVFPYRQGEKWSFSLRRLMKSQEYKLFIWIIIVVIAFHLKDEFMVEHERADTKIIGLFIAAFLLGIIDLIGELLKWKKIEV